MARWPMREGGLTTDASLRPRVSVLLGPGATFQGTADGLLGLYAAAAVPGGRPLRRATSSRARSWSTTSITSPPGRGSSTASGCACRCRSRSTSTAAPGSSTPTASARGPARSTAPGSGGSRARRTPLGIPDPLVELPQAAAALLAAHPDAAGARSGARRRASLRNPFADVFLVFAALRQLGAGAAGGGALAAREHGRPPGRLCWRATSAGSAMLRRLDAVLAGAPATVDPARVARARALLDAALFAGAPGQRYPGGVQRAARDAGAARGPRAAGRCGRRPTTRPAAITASCSAATSASGRSRRRRSSASTTAGPPTRGGCRPRPFIGRRRRAAADRRAEHRPAGDRRRHRRQRGQPRCDPPTRPRGDLERHPPVVGPRSRRSYRRCSSASRRWPPTSGTSSSPRTGSTSSPIPIPPMPGSTCSRASPRTGPARRWRTPRSRPSSAAPSARTGRCRSAPTGPRASGWRRSPRRPTGAARSSRRSAASTASSDRSAASSVAGAPIPVAQLVSSKQGVALILDSHINKPGRVGPNLRTAAQTPNLPAAADPRDRKITAVYHDIRDVYDRVHRNQGVDAQGFDVAHGSFTGW